MGRNRDSFVKCFRAGNCTIFWGNYPFGMTHSCRWRSSAVERIQLSVQCAECTWPSDDWAVPSNYGMIIGDLFPKSIGDAGHITYGNSCHKLPFGFFLSGKRFISIKPSWGNHKAIADHVILDRGLCQNWSYFDQGRDLHLKSSEERTPNVVFGNYMAIKVVVTPNLHLWFSVFFRVLVWDYPLSRELPIRAELPYIYIKESYLASLSKAQKVFVFQDFC